MKKKIIISVSGEIYDSNEKLTRCENCTFYDAGENEVDAWMRCKLHCFNTEPDNYCSWAVEKTQKEYHKVLKEASLMPKDI